MDTGEVRTRFTADTTNMASAFDDMRQRLASLAKDTDGLGDKGTTAADKMTKMGTSMATTGAQVTKVLSTISTPLIAMGSLAAYQAVRFEDSFAGVRKTVEGTKAELDALAAQLREMSKTMPVSTEMLNSIAEIAGQLGIAKDAIVPFVKTVADMGASTNLSSEAAANAFARIGSIMGLTAADFSKLGSTIVELGNKGASTEADIVNMAQRIAGAAAAVGMSSEDMVGLAAALSNVGIKAESGGTSMSKLITQIAGAVSAGGEDLDKFAKAAGMSGEAFAAAFKENAASGIAAFVEGMGKFKAAGGDLFTVLDDLGIGEARMRDMLLRSAAASAQFTETLATGRGAWEQNTALATEASKRYETTASQIEIFKNKLNDVQLTLGTAFLPMINNLLKGLEPIVQVFASWAQAFADLDPKWQTFIGAVVVGAAVLGPLLIALGSMVTAATALLPLIGGIGTALHLLPAAFAIVKTAFASMTAVLLANPWALVAAAIVALAAAVYYNWDRIENATKAAWIFIKTTSVDAWNAIKSAILEVVQGIYNGIKSWLSDKLNAVLDPIKSFSKEFLGIFQKTKDEVVSKSIVPEMVDEIGAEFERLSTVMVGPIDRAADAAEARFAAMKSNVGGGLPTLSGGGSPEPEASGGFIAFSGVAEASSKAESTVDANTQKIADHVEQMDIRIGSVSRIGAASLVEVARTGIFTVQDMQEQFAATSISIWSSATQSVSQGLADSIMDSHDWAATLRSLQKNMLASFINMGIQMVAAHLLASTARATITTSTAATETAVIATANATRVASDAVTATASVSIWAAASTAIIGWYASVAAGFAAIGASLIGVMTAVGTFVMGVLTAIASALSATIFGIPYAGAILLGVALIAGALMATKVIKLGAGGIVNKPTMGMIGEKGPEAVIPLDKLGSMGGPTQQTIIVELDGRVLSKAVTRQLFPMLRIQGVQAS